VQTRRDLLIRRRGAIETVAATDEVPARVDAIQYEVGQGPGLDAIAEHQVFAIHDLTHDDRWPPFSHRAAEETGVRSMLSFRLFVQGDTLGARNLYSRTPKAFNEHAYAAGTVRAAHAAVAMQAAGQQERADHLDDALATSREIGIAMGILMDRSRINQQQAFQVLCRTSQHLNRKLRDVAAELVETGQLPERRCDERARGPR
jgi:hypothetical protein